MRRAEPLADVIELRLDHLDRPAEFVLPRSEKRLVLTLRPQREGGRADDDAMRRVEIWNRILPQVSKDGDVLIDLERDIVTFVEVLPERRICSLHDLEGIPPRIDEIFDELTAGGSMAKIAYRADDVTDVIPLLKLLQTAAADSVPFIPAAMGEAGKFLRIIGPALGAAFSFSSLETGNETAAGQLSAADMCDVYRFDRLSRNSQIFGVIAGDTSYSTSPYIHNAAFAAAEKDAVFVPLQTRDAAAFLERMVLPSREVELNFAGFAVTNPHKKAVLPLIANVDEAAAAIGAINTIRVESDGTLTGTNTDAAGFIAPLLRRSGELRGSRAAIIGAGGAARACIFALRQAGCEPTVFAREPNRASDVSADLDVPVEQLGENVDLGRFDVVVNATPLGTKGKLQAFSPVAAHQLKGVKIAYDLTYVPAVTRFMSDAAAAGSEVIGGLEMLVEQAAAQHKFWFGTEAPVKEMTAAARKRTET